MRERLTHAQSGGVLANHVIWASDRWSRARGLIGSSLTAGRALVLEPGKQVHTFFMSQPIDVIFCDRSWNVLHVVSPMPRWRVSKWVRDAHFVVELPARSANEVRVGDQLEYQSCSALYPREK